MRSLTALQLSACLRVCPSARVAASELLSWGGGFRYGRCTAYLHGKQNQALPMRGRAQHLLYDTLTLECKECGSVGPGFFTAFATPNRGRLRTRAYI